MTEDPTAQPSSTWREPSGSGASPASASTTASSSQPQAQPAPSTPPPAQRQEDALQRSRVGMTWVGLIVFAIILILLLIFILQNRKSVQITYFVWDFSLPLAVAMLLAAVAGVLLAAIAGTWRIIQLRRRVRRQRRA